MTANGVGRRGSVGQAANGTWFLIVDVGVGLDRRQTRRRGFATRKAAQAELTRILGTLEQRTYVVPKRQTLSAFLTDVWLPAIDHTVKPGTFESYRRNVRLHIAGRPIGRRPLQEVDPTELNALYASLLAGDDMHRALGPRSVAYVAAILHRAFRDAIRWQAVIRNPTDAADPPRQSARKEMQTWSGAQVRMFLDSVDNDRLRGCWWLLANTGMRRGEVLGLRWEDVDFDAGTLRIVRTLITTDVQRKGSPVWRGGRRRPRRDAGRWSWARPPSAPCGRTARASSRSAWRWAATTTTRTWWSATSTARPSTQRRSATSSGRPFARRSSHRSASTTSGTRTPRSL
jgi:integrase